jgi:hypothetical protein
MNFTVQYRPSGTEAWGVLNYVMTEDFRSPGSTLQDALDKARAEAIRKMSAWSRTPVIDGELRVVEGDFNNCRPGRW